MTDLELTRKCAEAMGFTLKTLENGRTQVLQDGEVAYMIAPDFKIIQLYDPLHNDAQCFALVKRFELRLQEPEAEPSNDRRWRVTAWEPYKTVAQHTDLNRAVCECVAQLRKPA